MYLESKVLPAFRATVDTIKEPLSMKYAQSHGQCFIAEHVDPGMIKSRGEVYDFFEEVANYAKVKMTMYADQMDASQKQHTENMWTLAKGIVWAVEHDGFDLIKHMPVEKWGYDILSKEGNPCGGKK